MIYYYLCRLLTAHQPVPNAANRRYALSEDVFTSGACGEHVKLLEKYLTAPINLDRSGISLQGANSWHNIRSALRRFLGFCAQKKGEAAVAAAGVLHILDGPSVGGFVAWLLHSVQNFISHWFQRGLRGKFRIREGLRHLFHHLVELT